MAFPLIDVLIILFLVVFVIIGLVKGFWRSLIALFSSLITLIVAILLSKPLSNLMESWFHLSTALGNSFHGGVEGYITEHGYTSGWMGQVLNIIMGKDYMSAVTDQGILINDFSYKLGVIANVLICVVIVYILVKVALFFLSKLFSKLTSRGLMRGLDKTLGAIFGFVKGIFIVFVALGVMFELGSFITPIGDWLNGIMANNSVTNLLYGWTKQILQDVIIPFITK